MFKKGDVVRRIYKNSGSQNDRIMKEYDVVVVTSYTGGRLILEDLEGDPIIPYKGLFWSKDLFTLDKFLTESRKALK